MQDKTKKILTAAAIAVFILFFAAIAAFAGPPMIRFVSEPERFREWVDSYGAWSRIVFAAMSVTQIIVAIIPGEPLEIAAGYAFGAAEGTLLCMVSIVIGSTLIFLFVRKFGRRALEIFFPDRDIDSMKFIADSKKLEVLAFILFLIPGTPKDLMSYYMGLTRMKLSTLLLIAGTARIPSVVTSTFGGSALGDGNVKLAVIVFAVTAVISAAGFTVYEKKKKQ